MTAADAYTVECLRHGTPANQRCAPAPSMPCRERVRYRAFQDQIWEAFQLLQLAVPGPLCARIEEWTKRRDAFLADPRGER